MRRALVLIAALAGASLLAPAAASADRFGALLSCAAGGADRDIACFVDARPVAVFRAFLEENVRYTVCIRKPGGRPSCRRKQTRQRRRHSRERFRLSRPGGYKVTWFVAGRRVARRNLVVQPRKLFVNGDSLAVGTRPYLPPALPDWSITQSTSISRHAPEGVGILSGRALRPVTVMQLGTNDDPHAEDDFRFAIRATMKLVGPRRCVVWANIVRPAVGGRSYAGYNQILAEENRRFDNLFVVDWVEMVRSGEVSVYGDGVHPNATGYKARARAIADKVELCHA